MATHALEQSQRDGAPVTLVLCDVDLFKRVNGECSVTLRERHGKI